MVFLKLLINYSSGYGIVQNHSLGALTQITGLSRWLSCDQVLPGVAIRSYRLDEPVNSKGVIGNAKSPIENSCKAHFTYAVLRIKPL
jgi:hypothetical protein